MQVPPGATDGGGLMSERVILCIDDDPDFLEQLEAILTSGGYKVVKAESASEGFEKLEETTPCLIVVDCMMETIDSGIEFAKELKKRGNTAPVVMTSNIGDGLYNQSDTAKFGLAGVLQKPVDRTALLDLVAKKIA